jgi:hypothetical protein
MPYASAAAMKFWPMATLHTQWVTMAADTALPAGGRAQQVQQHSSV